MREDDRLELDACGVAVLAREHVHLPLVDAQLTDVRLQQQQQEEEEEEEARPCSCGEAPCSLVPCAQHVTCAGPVRSTSRAPRFEEADVRALHACMHARLALRKKMSVHCMIG